MKNYVIINGQFNEVDPKSKLLKDIEGKIFFEGLDLEGDSIIVYDLTRDKLQPLVEKVVTARFSAASSKKNKLITLVLLIIAVGSIMQWTNYKAQTNGLTLALEQAQKDKSELIQNNKPVVNIPKIQAEKTEKIEPTPVIPNFNIKNQELEYQLELMSLTNKKQELVYQNNIEILDQKLKFCEDQSGGGRIKTDLEMYQEIQNQFTDDRKAELKNIVKYEYIDQARIVAQKYCSKIK